MAETFSIGEAMASPFRVVRRHPLAVFVWGFLVMAVSLAGAGMVLGLLRDLPLAETAEPPPAFFESLLAMQGLSLLANVAQLAAAVVVWAATMRAALRIGRPDRAFFLRFGKDELHLAVIGIALFLGTYVAVVVLVLLGGVLVAVLWQASEAAAVLAGSVLMLALFAAVAVAMARLSLIAPASLILNRLAFVEGWRLGRGRTPRLLGLLACTWLSYVVLYGCVMAVVVLVAFASGFPMQLMTAADPQTLNDVLPSGTTLAWLAAAALGPGAFLYGAIMTLLCAPFASACRQLMDGPAVARPGDDALAS